MKVKEVFLKYLSWDEQSVENMITTQQYSYLKINQLKDILKYYKSNGYPQISLNFNKGGLVAVLKGIIEQELNENKSETSVGPAISSHETNIPQRNGSTSSSSSHAPPRPILPPPLARVPSIPPSGGMLPMSTIYNPFQGGHERDHDTDDDDGDDESSQQQKNLPHINLPVYQQIIINPLNRRVFTELQMSSFTAAQITDAIKDNYNTPDALIDFDILMLAILSKVEPDPPAPVFDEESFNRDLDMAILNSEGERDAIQSRKKKRKLEVQTEKGISLSSAEEFRGSALLGKRMSISNGQMPSSESQALERGSQLLIQLLSRLESDEAKYISAQQNSQIATSDTEIPALSSTKSTSEMLPRLDANMARAHSLPLLTSRSSNTPPNPIIDCLHRTSSLSNSDIVERSLFNSCPCACGECTLSQQLLSEIRATISSILYLESDAYKWYKDDSIPYFLKLGCRLDQLLDPNLISPPQKPLCPSTSFLSYMIPHSILPAIRIEIEAVTRILLLFPSSAGGVPEEFRKVDPEGMGKKWKVKDYDIEDDGFEIIDPVSNK